MCASKFFSAANVDLIIFIIMEQTSIYIFQTIIIINDRKLLVHSFHDF